MMNTSIPFHSIASIRASRVCALLALAGALLAVAAPARCTDATWVATGSLNLARANHAATLLPDGKVLVVGGAGTSAELYDPATGKWTQTGALGHSRSEVTATLLDNGQVLVVGGDRGEISPESLAFLGTCELYDPATKTWRKTGSLNTPRDGFTATLLQNGEVLVAGGVDSSDVALDTAEIYDPIKGTWRYTGSFGGARFWHAATRLADGKVLIVGGSSDDFFLTAIGGATIYDPATQTWASVEGLYTPRAQPTATLLANGKVLVAGGFGSLSYTQAGYTQSTAVSYALADLFDPITHWSSTAPMVARRNGHTATLLPSGEVLVTGGNDLNANAVLSSTELYDPATATWRSAPSMLHARHGHTATVLSDGRVLVVGGLGTRALLTSAEILQPANVPAGTISAAFTGAWYDPAQNGHGLFVEVLSNNRFQAAWFAFDPSGNKQAWFTGVGEYNGNTATISDVVLPTDGRFIPNFDAAAVVRNRWGSLTFTFTDCNHGRVDFNSVAGYGSGSMSISRLTQPAGLACP